jgi:hypothetical protein
MTSRDGNGPSGFRDCATGAVLGSILSIRDGVSIHVNVHHERREHDSAWLSNINLYHINLNVFFSICNPSKFCCIIRESTSNSGTLTNLIGSALLCWIQLGNWPSVYLVSAPSLQQISLKTGTT